MAVHTPALIFVVTAIYKYLQKVNEDKIGEHRIDEIKYTDYKECECCNH